MKISIFLLLEIVIISDLKIRIIKFLIKSLANKTLAYPPQIGQLRQILLLLGLPALSHVASSL